MSNLTPQLVDRYIKPFRKKYTLIKKDYRTDDIMEQILEADKTNAHLDVMELSKHIRYTDLNDLCTSIFTLLRTSILYQEDELGFQGVKDPAALWATKTGDCKSYSLFTNSIFKCLGIPYIYRFASYRKTGIVGHVYPIAVGLERNIIVDAVYGHYNKEKQPTVKPIDFQMEGLYRIQGVGAPTERVTRLQKPVAEMTDADMDLFIAKQRLEIERDIAAKKGGLGSVKAEEYDRTLSGLNAFIGAVNNNDYYAMDSVINAVKNPRTADMLNRIKEKHKKQRPALILNLSESDFERMAVSGVINDNHIGSLKSLVKKVTKAADKAANKVVKVMPKPLQKVTSAVIKTVSAPTKLMVKASEGIVKASVAVLKAPLQLTVKAAIEVALPKAAPGFLYLFVNDQKLIDQLPPKVRAKRARQTKLADFVVKEVGMKREHLMGILRNGIMKKYGKSPEAQIALMMKKPGVAGIGIVTAILGLVTAVIQLIAKMKGKKKGDVPSVTADDVPDDNDFAVVAESASTVVDAAAQLESLKATAAQQPTNTELKQQIRTLEAKAQAPTTQQAVEERKAELEQLANEVVAQPEAQSTTIIPADGGRKAVGICG